jgi:mono/diheme cytochrome c family protein
MQGKTLILTALAWGGVFLILSACQGTSAYAAAAAPQALAQEQPTAPAPGMGSGVHHAGQQYAQMGGGGMGGGMGGGGMGGGMMGGQGYQGSQQQYQRQYQQRSGGAGLFANNCASCHPNGGNVVVPNMPLRGAPQLSSFSSFRAIVRQGRGPMPAFPASNISDAQLRELYRYVRSTYGR